MAETPADNIPEISTAFAADAFPLDVIKKAAYRLTNRAAFDFRQDGGEIICRLEFASPLPQSEAEALVREFRGEVLDQDLRRSIAEETAPLRNAILGYAFSRTGLQDD